MLFRETVAVYCENYMEHINTLCGQSAKFRYVKTADTSETTKRSNGYNVHTCPRM
jgi:hypothetical protein